MRIAQAGRVPAFAHHPHTRIPIPGLKAAAPPPGGRTRLCGPSAEERLGRGRVQADLQQRLCVLG